eukprot:CAMPEP_0197072028 /NCGR_PEP_ID=MMETSP1384-20130603/209891_1 /TAXON_ID=29189 /ORGANISM="Ammonia sp." /LENGTH=225 /DNA_ID=CAMNT_0042510841 /DNA_START=155 /DNA_END=830 /DNA_ORIENTATION=-
MYPSPDMKQEDNEIDEDQVYCTNASITTVGRAVAVDLGDAMLPGDEKHKHMTIFFRKGGNGASPDMKQEDNAIDEDQVYCTNASITTVGRAVAVDLGDAMLPGDEKHKHMTIFFRKGGKWSGEEIALLSSESAAWITKRFGLNAPVTFTIAQWGPHSVLIKGDLESLCVHLRTKFAAMSQERQREPHVALFRAKRGGGRGHYGKGKDHRKEKKDHKEKTCRICDQ